VFACRRRQYLASLALGLLNPLFYYLVLFKAYEILPAQVAQPLNYTWALTLTYLSIPLLGQKIGMKEAAAGVICYSGVLVITTRGDITGFRFSDPVGVGLALFSTVIWALYWIYSTKDKREPVVVLLLNFLFSLPFTAGLCFLFSDFRVTGIYGLLGAIYVGAFEMGITFVLWLTALKLSANTARVGNLIFISPFLSLVFIHFLLGEAILPATFFGLALIVAGLFVQRLEMKS
jgi:drug/metabolite transporter (DMT)-like permease